MCEISRELEARKFMRAGDFLYAAGDPGMIRDIAPGAKTLEGFLFPATYELPRHPVASELTAEMVRKFKEAWKHIASPVTGGPTGTAAPPARKRIATPRGLVHPTPPYPAQPAPPTCPIATPPPQV